MIARGVLVRLVRARAYRELVKDLRVNVVCSSAIRSHAVGLDVSCAVCGGARAHCKGYSAAVGFALAVEVGGHPDDFDIVPGCLEHVVEKVPKWLGGVVETAFAALLETPSFVDDALAVHVDSSSFTNGGNAVYQSPKLGEI